MWMIPLQDWFGGSTRLGVNENHDHEMVQGPCVNMRKHERLYVDCRSWQLTKGFICTKFQVNSPGGYKTCPANGRRQPMTRNQRKLCDRKSSTCELKIQQNISKMTIISGYSYYFYHNRRHFVKVDIVWQQDFNSIQCRELKGLD
jgi:hypothetical protein